MPQIELTLAHSPDPDDVFMWWPVTGMIDPRDPDRVVSPPEIDTGRFRFRAIPADIAVLNKRAAESGDLDITALSMFAWAHVRERYLLTSFGASMGYGYGPKVVGRAPAASRLASPVCYADEPGAAATDGLSALLAPGALVAVPGVRTTAFLLLSMMLGEHRSRLHYVEMPFDHILDAVAGGERGVTHGLLIHQSQLTFAEQGMTEVADTGEWWLRETGLPLPLGGNAVRSDLDARLGPGTTQEVVDLLDRSIRYGLDQRARSLRYAMQFAPEITLAQADRYIDMYVSDLTLDAGEAGAAAVQRLLDEAAKLGMCPPIGRVEMLRPGCRAQGKPVTPVRDR